MIGEHAIRNGVLISSGDATVPIALREVQYGFFTYESLRVLQGLVVHLEDHLERLRRSCEGVKMTHPFDYDRIGEWVTDLIKADGIGDATMKITLYGGSHALCFVTSSPLLSYPDSFYRDGVKIITYGGERLMPSCKTGNLLLNYMALEEAHGRDAFEAVLVNREGRMLEGTRSNFYAFRDGRLYTARDEDVLLGVTRSRVLRAASSLSIPVVFEAPGKDDVLSGEYDEVFISATSMAAMTVRQVDDTAFRGPFSRTREIRALVRKWETGDE